VDGAALMGVDADDPELRRLARSGLPCVGVDVELGGDDAAYVASDNVGGGRLAVEHLVSLGHRRIATIAGPMETRPGRDRLRGYRDALRDAGLAFRDEYVGMGDFYLDSGVRAAAELLALDEPPTAIAAASDLMAVGALRAASAAGARVPDDLSVVGFDDIMLAAHLEPALTTIRQDKAGLGAAAARALLARVDGPEEGVEEHLTLEVQLVERATTAPARG
jgi:LacI family transcriptional regulator